MHDWISAARQFRPPVLRIPQQTLSLCLNSSGECQLCFHSCCFYSLHMLHVCWCDILVVMYMNSIFLSVFSSVSSPSVWVIVPAKTLVINRDFWYAHSSKRWPEWQNGIGLSVTTCYMCLLLLCALIISPSFRYPHSLNLDFPCIGLSLLSIFMPCFDTSLPPDCVKWCTRCSGKSLP